MALRDVVYEGVVFKLAYLKYNAGMSKNMVFLHGWGSNKELMFNAFKESFLDYTHYYIDLPGFGQSPYGEQGIQSTKVLDSADYARILDSFLASLGVKDCVIVGHSFGGKVAMLCHNQEVILLSSAGIVRKKPLLIRLKILFAKIMKVFHIRIPFLRAKDANGLNATMYEVFKYVVNEDFYDIFAKSTKKVSIFWGRQDRATPLDSGQKIHSLIPNSRFFALEGDHYFFLQQARIIETMYNTTEEQYVHILVFGKVQGVGYRKFTLALAQEYGILGSVQNLADGSVEIYAYGSDDKIARFTQALHKGSSRAEVQEVRITPIQEKADYTTFVIL